MLVSRNLYLFDAAAVVEVESGWLGEVRFELRPVCVDEPLLELVLREK